MTMIRIARREGWTTSPRGVRHFYPAGDYRVPDQMPPEIARRCLESNIGIEVRTKDTKPETKQPTAAKKKRFKIESGAAQSLRPPGHQ